MDAIHGNRCHPIFERCFGVPEQTEWRVAKGRYLIVRRDRKVDGMRDLRGHAVEGECRDEANDTLWNFEGHRYEIWIAKRLSTDYPVQTASQLLQELIVSKCIECPRMYPQLHCSLCIEHAAIRSENAQSSLGGGGWR